MRKIALLLFCFTTLSYGTAFSEDIPQRLDGYVLRVDPEKRILFLGFEHPATGEHIEKKFFVRKEAGFKDFKKLNDLKKGDLVSLDYLDQQPIPTAIYVIYIPLKKVYFTHKEIAEALVKIGSNSKGSDDKEG